MKERKNLVVHFFLALEVFFLVAVVFFLFFPLTPFGLPRPLFEAVDAPEADPALALSFFFPAAEALTDVLALVLETVSSWSLIFIPDLILSTQTERNCFWPSFLSNSNPLLYSVRAQLLLWPNPVFSSSLLHLWLITQPYFSQRIQIDQPITDEYWFSNYNVFLLWTFIFAQQKMAHKMFSCFNKSLLSSFSRLNYSRPSLSLRMISTSDRKKDTMISWAPGLMEKQPQVNTN